MIRQETQAVEIPLWVVLMAVFAAGLAASLLAAKREFDITGVLMLTIVAALGGGIIRDTLIQRGTPAAFRLAHAARRRHRRPHSLRTSRRHLAATLEAGPQTRGMRDNR